MKDLFTTRIKQAEQLEADAQKQFNKVALLRILLFAVAITCGWYVHQTSSTYAVIGAILSTIGFLLLLKKQEEVKRQRDFQRAIQTINKDEIGRLSNTYSQADTGEQFAVLNHPYASDLDIFGKHSLYRHLNRTTTYEGASRFAAWLLSPAPLEAILGRQEALQEARKELEWRQAWQAIGMQHKDAANSVSVLRRWLETPLPSQTAVWLKARWLAPLVVLSIIGWWLGYSSGWIVLGLMAVNTLIIGKFKSVIHQISTDTYQIGHTLVAYGALMSHLKQVPYQSKWWQAQAKDASEAAVALQELGKWFNRLDFRNNVYFSLLIGVPILWDLICLAALERWKKRYQNEFESWVDGLANVEALNSLAGYAFSNPEVIMPTVSWSNELVVKGVGIAHPLLKSNKRVANSFALSGIGTTHLITGSNMSGKSTFLRTVGLQLVMAQMGSAVPASAFECTLVQVFTSMRTQDSLEESTSSFYAELKRLKQLIDRSENQQQLPLFYLLDEILKGTNSADRHLGAATLIKQLHLCNASGLVSTHDLELGEWAERVNFVQNYHFSSEMENGQIVFDYQLKNGICKSFNASELMKVMGIKIDLHGEKIS